ncbi:unnamed protein product [Ceratitis capitata]|uniref:(Mediterranean fruit fly) hypothetical protein n=1 Tax=Ceratitis capitata TaxID=7213 RepID=A0A811UPJ3_CERCA|nr:unnamed protein product [Ceratitis capitata]
MHAIRQKCFIPHLERKMNQIIADYIECITHNRKLHQQRRCTAVHDTRRSFEAVGRLIEKYQSNFSTPPIIASDSRNEYLLNYHDGRRDTCLYKILPVILMAPQANVKVYSLLNEGSSVTLFGSRRQHNWTQGSDTTIVIKKNSRALNLDVRRGHFSLKISIPYPYLDLPVQTFYPHQYICFHSITEMTVHAGPNEPIAVATKLGWVAYGSAPSISASVQCLLVRKSPTPKQPHQLGKPGSENPTSNFGIR